MNDKNSGGLGGKVRERRRMEGGGRAVIRQIEGKNKQMHLEAELAAQPRLVCQRVEDSVSASR